jgi:hypothetical protein
MAVEKAREEKVRRSVDGPLGGEKRGQHLVWEGVEKEGMRKRERRESRASRGSGWSRARLSFERRRGGDEEEGVGLGLENGVR